MSDLSILLPGTIMYIAILIGLCILVFYLIKYKCLIKSIIFSFVIIYFPISILNLIDSLKNYDGYCYHPADISYPCSVSRIAFESFNPLVSEWSLFGYIMLYIPSFIICSIIILRISYSKMCRKNKK